jgi:hydrogenase nickel incorporation protein HypA/HybF
MHELSVATSIIETVRRSVPAQAQPSVHCVNIRLGTQAGIVTDSLLFCFDILKTGLGIKNASLHIEHIPFSIFCSTCDKTLRNDSGLLVCPLCGGTDTNIASGTELQIVDVELET